MDLERDQIEASRVGKTRHYNPMFEDYATFLRTSEETGGEYTLIYIEVGPGGGVTPHYHKTYDEHFTVLEGTLEVQLNKDTRTLAVGDTAVAHKTVVHRFHNPTDEPTRFLVELRPGVAGFEKGMKVAYGLARDGRTFANGTPKNLHHTALIIEWSEIRVPGPLTIAEPLLRLLAIRARRKGIDRVLEATYCR